jgi:hypothetical protein
MKHGLFLIPTIALATTACATTPAPPAHNGLSYGHIGQEVSVDGPRVTPLAVLEDSRCPANVTCVWAGRVRISAKVTTGRGSEPRELTLGQPIAVADGTLLLGDVLPARKSRDVTAASDYRFGFRFDGGL